MGLALTRMLLRRGCVESNPGPCAAGASAEQRTVWNALAAAASAESVPQLSLEELQLLHEGGYREASAFGVPPDQLEAGLRAAKLLPARVYRILSCLFQAPPTSPPLQAAADESFKWSERLLTVDEGTPEPAAEELWAFLSGSRLPISQLLHDRLMSIDAATQHAVQECTCIRNDTYAFTAYFEKVLGSTPLAFGCGTYAELSGAMALLMEDFLRQLCLWAHHPTLSSLRDTSDPTSRTLPSIQPDLSIWDEHGIVFKAQHSLDAEGLQAAVDKLGADMCQPWDCMTCGDLPYLFCCATAGLRLQFCVLKRDSTVAEPLGQEFDLQQPGDRLRVMQVMMNAGRLAHLLQHLTREVPLPLGASWPCNNGTHVVFKARTVVKTVLNYSRQQNTNHDHRIVSQIYADTAEAEGLVHAVRPPTLNSDGTYTVELYPLGHQCTPYSEAALKAALRCPLAGLAALHARGYVHHDVSMHNMLCDAKGSYFFSDLEGAGDIDSQSGCQVPEEVLVDGQYTTTSDMKMLGRMFHGIMLSAEGKALRQQLLTGQVPSAQEALADPWFL